MKGMAKFGWIRVQFTFQLVKRKLFKVYRFVVECGSLVCVDFVQDKQVIFFSANDLAI